MRIQFEAVKHQLQLIGHDIPDEVIHEYLEQLNATSGTQHGEASTSHHERRVNDTRSKERYKTSVSSNGAYGRSSTPVIDGVATGERLSEAGAVSTGPSGYRIGTHASAGTSAPCDSRETSLQIPYTSVSSSKYAEAGSQVVDDVLPDVTGELSIRNLKFTDTERASSRASNPQPGDDPATAEHLAAQKRASDFAVEVVPTMQSCCQNNPCPPTFDDNMKLPSPSAHTGLSKDTDDAMHLQRYGNVAAANIHSSGVAGYSARQQGVMEDLQQRIDRLLQGDTPKTSSDARIAHADGGAAPDPRAWTSDVPEEPAAEAHAVSPAALLRSTERPAHRSGTTPPSVTAKAVEILQRHERLRRELVGEPDASPGSASDCGSYYSDSHDDNEPLHERPLNTLRHPETERTVHFGGKPAARALDTEVLEALSRRSGRGLQEATPSAARPGSARPASARPSSAASSRSYLRQPVNADKSFVAGRAHPSGTVRKVDRVARYNQLQQQWKHDPFLRHTKRRPIEGFNQKFAVAHAQARAGMQDRGTAPAAPKAAPANAYVPATSKRRDAVRWETRLRMHLQE